ncbi:UNVERIFIED_CONTAM: hypothetical protein RMT77_001130 [Armadillidium vulgare]
MILAYIIAACIWPVNNWELEANLTFSCKESIKIIEQTKAKFKYYKNYLVPEISCLACSQPILGTSSSKGKSTLKFPLYNNILEFGFVKRYIPMNTNVAIKINDECSYKLVVTRDANPKVIQTNLFECLNNECLNEINEHYINLTENEKCLHIGLMFIEKNWLYLSFSRKCKYVPTVYFDLSTAIASRVDECMFRAKTDTLSVSFEFSINSSYPMDAVPVTLPCSPGGYVVNHVSGKFYTGSKCEANFIDPEILSNDTGIDLVVKFLYGENESLVFPNKSSQKYASTTYPIYLFENGNAASREEMAPKVEKDEMSKYEPRKMCSIGNVSERLPKCNEEESALLHETYWLYDVKLV